MEPYYTVLIPLIGPKHQTEWHPTTQDMPTLSRGVFKHPDKAIEWAQEHLNGTPYTIVFVR